MLAQLWPPPGQECSGGWVGRCGTGGRQGGLHLPASPGVKKNGGGGFGGYLLPSSCSCSVCDERFDFCLFAASLGGVVCGRQDCFCCLLCGGQGE